MPTLKERLDALIADAQAREQAELDMGFATPSAHVPDAAPEPTVTPFREVLPQRTAHPEDFTPGTTDPFGALLGRAVGLRDPGATETTGQYLTSEVLPHAAKEAALWTGGGMAARGIMRGARAAAPVVGRGVSRGMRALNTFMTRGAETPGVGAAVNEARNYVASGYSPQVAGRLAGVPSGGRSSATIIRHQPQQAVNPVEMLTSMDDMVTQGFSPGAARKATMSGVPRQQRSALDALSRAGREAREAPLKRDAALRDVRMTLPAEFRTADDAVPGTLIEGLLQRFPGIRR